MSATKKNLEFVENNDPTADFVCTLVNELTGLRTYVNLTSPGTVAECYVKPDKDTPDNDPSVDVYSTSDPAQVQVLDATVAEHEVAAPGAVARVFFQDMALNDKTYHLDVIKDGRRLTHAEGKIKVRNV